jgi:WD40 repeat protein
MASASKDETVIIWNLEKIKQNLNKTIGVDQTDYIITMIDEHEHVIDCIKFANEAARKIIQSADYSKIRLQDLNQTNNSGDPNETTGDMTRNEESAMEESKRMDESEVND